jgi:hypothetical protein
MGLTIHFDLALPASTPDAEVLARLQHLHDFAARHVPLTITPLVTLTRAQIEADLEPRSFEWLLGITDEVMHIGYNLGDDAADTNSLAIAAFGITPGEGCDLAMFALAAPIPSAVAVNVDAPVRIHDWHWAGFCKTQYASNVSDEHFVRCHRMIVAILDEAERLGFELEVRDEGRYWETRSVQVLLTEVSTMNHILARVAGALHDAMPEENGFDAEIFRHPDFEHLEMGRAQADGC